MQKREHVENHSETINPLKKIYNELSKNNDLDEEEIIGIANCYTTAILTYLRGGVGVEKFCEYFLDVGVKPKEIMYFVFLYMTGALSQDLMPWVETEKKNDER